MSHRVDATLAAGATPTITVRIPSELAARLDAEAARITALAGIRAVRGEVIRLLLREALDARRDRAAKAGP